MLNSPNAALARIKTSYVQIVEVEVNRIKEVMQEKKGAMPSYDENPHQTRPLANLQTPSTWTLFLEKM